MWLPKDERKLLAFYFRDLPEASFSKKYTSNSMKVVKANRNLSRRRLINLEEYEDARSVIFRHGWAERDLAEFLLDSKDTGGSCTTIVELTLDGWDLGRKYNNRWERGKLWWGEQKQHWLWSVLAIIVTFLLGLLAGRMMQTGSEQTVQRLKGALQERDLTIVKLKAGLVEKNKELVGTGPKSQNE